MASGHPRPFRPTRSHRRTRAKLLMAVLFAAIILVIVVPNLAQSASSGPFPVGPANILPAAPITSSSSGDCTWLSYHGIAYYFWTDDGSGDHTDRFVLFTPHALCTLKTARVYVFTPACTGTPTLRLRIYGEQWPLDGGDPYPDSVTLPPGTGPNLVSYVDVPWEDFVEGWNTIDLTGLPEWPDDFIVGNTTGSFFLSVSLSPSTPNPGTDVIAFITDDGDGDHRSGAYIDGRYRYNDDYYSSDFGLFLEAEVCYSYQPPDGCVADEWPTWAHDYNRSCRSSIAVGDPCQIQAAWQVDLDNYSTFCEPTIADGRVYISTDSRVDAFDLSTGSLIGSVSGPPYIRNYNRGNLTIDDGFVYVTGGNAGVISKWDADFTTALWCKCTYNPPTSSLYGPVRFGVTAVYEIDGTKVVIIGTENGYLWCLDAATGAAYSGWPTNPIALHAGILHAPAYDGDDLYVGTAGTESGGNAIYRVDAYTGRIVWVRYSSDPTEGYSSGVTLEANFIYAASDGPDQTGHRIKLDKDGEVIWEFSQSRSLYGPPAYNHNFIFMPQDGAYPGVYMVDKVSGNILYNFGVDGIGPVPQHVTLTCDDYMFAGDRLGNWWISDLTTLETTRLHHSEFGGIVNGTALATDPATGDDYAVVSIRSGNPTNSFGQLLAFRLHAGFRPRVLQTVSAVEVSVPFDAPSSNSHTASDVLTNIGCNQLTISSHNISDPLPDPVARTYTDTYSRYAASTHHQPAEDSYTAYFSNGPRPKTGERLRSLVDGELTSGDIAVERVAHALINSKHQTQRRQAAATILRTSSVSYNGVLNAGISTDVTWDYDGTGLQRGVDIEEVEFITDDPDRVFFGNQPTVVITYKGGCLRDSMLVSFGDVTPDKSEQLYNSGHVGDNRSDGDLIWQGMAGALYDGSFVLCGDYLDGDPATGEGGPQFHAAMYDGGGNALTWPGYFVPNPLPGGSTCGFDGESDIHLGFKRTPECPGAPIEILGEWARSYYADTNDSAPAGSPLAAVGVNIEQTEVGAYDPKYGDFKMIRWTLRNRDGEQKTLHTGTVMDWDAGPEYKKDVAIVSDQFNGYAIWNDVDPTTAYGMFDPMMPSHFETVDPTVHSPHRIIVRLTPEGGVCLDPDDRNCFFYDSEHAWRMCVEFLPAREVHYGSPSATSADLFALLINRPVTLDPHGDVNIHQVLFGVDATTSDSATIEANVLELAERAAKWAGFARGDVNDDGTVDVLDVCWLLSGHQLYPDEYNGDVDLSGTVNIADQTYLLQYVTGLGPPPLGAWRFEF
ncbi:MAG: PQQ-binding-like beta-propeller repeat protein [candidate division Zixibacteria bacterium]|nr:PQQ-binding-like beta-propeller repeat protein [candidate division Zixibacteria bacterium]